jgi:hypothetical protein
MKVKVDVSSALKGLGNVKSIATAVEQIVAPRAVDFFRKKTPKGNPSTWQSKPPKNYVPGNARAKTRLEKKTTIVADYAYAQALEDGWSPQAPQGMITATEKFVAQESTKVAKQLLNKAGK